ncbi:MAG: FTR1 family protein [Rickettsiaceae bacterium]|nr:FTR1 family protein [Rickettsiaceae bacterium]MDP4832445.1 FTR1 family protein [Rickettsiaceae bacterium]MDP5020419.1 FTR1 family protein [Rickettsiaceae bacterium]MDP5083547.1 FTR1 family protein [Rickettsiaceae bacterium]
MFKIAIVVFRECLEIAFLLGVIMAATKPIQNSKLYIIFGTMLGVVCAAIFALFTRSITSSFGGLGDEIFDAAVILLTAVIISCTVVWMQGYTKKVRKDLSKLSDKIAAGSASKFMLVLAVAMAILREGAEIILFVYSIASTQTIDSNGYLLGLGIGGAAGLIVGTIIYKGLIKYAGKYIFIISTILLTLIAAGLSAEAAGILTSSGIIEIYSDQLWDTSWLVSNESITGKILNITTGYDSRPNGMQIAFYFATIAVTIAMIKLQSKVTDKKHV